jgi:hypothetical protein
MVLNPVAVSMARDLLSSGGIECFVFDEHACRVVPGAVPIRLMVHAADYDEALEALKRLGFSK